MIPLSRFVSCFVVHGQFQSVFAMFPISVLFWCFVFISKKKRSANAASKLPPLESANVQTERKHPGGNVRSPCCGPPHAEPSGGFHLGDWSAPPTCPQNACVRSCCALRCAQVVYRTTCRAKLLCFMVCFVAEYRDPLRFWFVLFFFTKRDVFSDFPCLMCFTL